MFGMAHFSHIARSSITSSTLKQFQIFLRGGAFFLAVYVDFTLHRLSSRFSPRKRYWLWPALSLYMYYKYIYIYIIESMSKQEKMGMKEECRKNGA